MSRIVTHVLPFFLLVGCSLLDPAPAEAGPEHPFLLWTADDAARLRKRIETESWAEMAYEQTDDRLLKYSVMGDRAAGEAEKEILLDHLQRGRVANVEDALRFDVLYDLLSEGERQRIETAFRRAVEEGVRSMEKQRPLNRWNWLPNLGYKWYTVRHVLAAATGDEELIRTIWAGPYGLKWYFDEYLSDSGFYNEEFSKMYNTPDKMMLWCEAMENLGLEEIGYDYRGRQGATMRGHCESLLKIGYPRVDLGTGRPQYPRVTIGDARGNRGVPAYGFQHVLVPGWLRHRPVDKRRDWVENLFQMAHARWPDAGFGYFLAQYRAPDEEAYPMPLRYGIAPIRPEDIEPPAANSGVYTGRGLVMLRADEGKDYWESPGPAVSMRLATPYAHHVQDCLALTGFYAYNRPIFVNHQHSTNYSGVDPGYSNSIRSHSAVIVDGAEPRTIGEIPTQHHFGKIAKFANARGQGIYEGVDQSRALVLTPEYLLDVSHLSSDRPREYVWQIQTFGQACPDKPEEWTDTRGLSGVLPDIGQDHVVRTRTSDEDWAVTSVQTSLGAHEGLAGLGEEWFDRRVGVRTTVLGEKNTTAYHGWSPVVQDASGHWRGRNRFAHGEDEPAGVAIVARRTKPDTTFVAVHEPFEGVPTIDITDRVRQLDGSVLVVIERSPEAATRTSTSAFRDYVLLPTRFGEAPRLDISFAAFQRGEWPTRPLVEGGEYAFVRQTPGRIDVEGDLSSLMLPVGHHRPELQVNGQAREATYEDGWLIYGDPQKIRDPAGTTPWQPRDRPNAAVVVARWRPDQVLCLPENGTAHATLWLRNVGWADARGELYIVAEDGLKVSPATVDLDGFAPGQEREIEVTLRAGEGKANRLAAVRLRPDVVPAIGGSIHSLPEGRPIDAVDHLFRVQPAELKVAVGVATEREQVGKEWVQTVY
ncbi:MAG: hypothetical protein ACOC93_04235, partial [Planctomycetota bacterium]